MATDDRFCLRVRNLPAVLSNEAITSLFTHYGATRVRVLQRRNAASSGKEPGGMTCKQVQKAIAIFATREAQQNARRRLHLLELAGQHLQVEVVGDEAASTSSETKPETVETRDHVALPSQPPLPKGLPPPLPQTPVPVQNSLYAPVPLAPHLGLNYAPSPLLEYKYPKASESIVRNIANALIALPRFYTQVLHLMNKMNLPPPFEEDAIPGRFSIKQDMKCGSEDPREQHLKRRRTDKSVLTQIVEEEEEEEGSDDDNAVRGKQLQTIDVHPPLQAQQRTKDVSSVTDRRPNVGQKSTDAPRQDQIELTGKLFTHRFSSIKKSSTLNTAFQLDTDKGSYRNVSRPIRPGVISENEVNRLRLSRKELMKVPLMKSYVRGVPSSTIVVNNISHTMDEKDLRSVFGYVLPMDMNLDSIQMNRLPAKGSALITYPDQVLATAAVNALHGVELEGKTLIVGFSTTCKAFSDASVARWTLQDLENKRLLESQLALEKAMSKYEHGQDSDTLYVKNLAKTVELADLFAVFGAVLPPESGPDDLSIQHFTVGRMKCQAFVKYTTVQLASSALHQVHGVVLKDKPLIVCFRKPQSDKNEPLL